MKVELNENGKMIIEAETALERFALKAWIRDNSDNRVECIVFDFKPKPTMKNKYHN